MFWPRPQTMKFQLSASAAVRGMEIVEADILVLDRCWRGSTPKDYIQRMWTFHAAEFDGQERENLINNPGQLVCPEVMMLGNSHVAICEGIPLFVLLREMADLGFLRSIPFAVRPCDLDRFRFYFREPYRDGWLHTPLDKTPLGEQAVLQLYGA